MRSGVIGTGLSLLLLLVLALTLVTPIVAVVAGGFTDGGHFTLQWFRDALDYELYRTGLWNSVWLAFYATLLCLIISIPLALMAENFQFAGKRVWLALIQVPMILPPFVGALGMKGILSRNGGINSVLAWLGWIDPTNPIDWLNYPFWSCVVLEALYLYPITFLNVQAALANIDPALDEAARNLGAGPWRRFWKITLPLMRPGIFAGSTIVFIWSFTELGTPLMVGYGDVTAVQVFRELETTNPAGDSYALVVLLLVASVALYMVGKMLLGRPGAAMMAKATVASAPARPGLFGTLLVTLPFAFVFFVAFLPHIGVILASISSTGMLEVDPDKLTLKHHTALLGELAALGQPGRGMAALSVLNSFKYAIIATAIDLVLGFVIAYLAVRRRSWLTSLLDGLSMLPLAVPGLVMAFGYFALTQGDSPVAFLNPLRNDPTPLLVIAYAVRRLPFQVRSCAAGLEQMSVALEEASLNLGAGPVRTIWKVTIPLLTANFIAGGLLVFSRSMLEVSDSLMLAFDQSTFPLTKAIWYLAAIPQNGVETASALGVWGMVILIITIAGASLALGKRLGALFRV
ncbi:Putrescine transport system permease protein PotH [Phycisphaerae bacterium RAS1]|nr:Putrescine transport system permease protein PotH [Phycisphaerae bacterium RAS1]